MLEIYFAIIGLIIGSFLNVCIFRIPKEQSISYPPSHCMKCGERIKPYDLIPVLSYILLKGKCRNCGDKISIRYPMIELFTGIIFLTLYMKFGLTLAFFKYAVFSCFLIVIGMIDLDTTDVYQKTTISGIIAAAAFVIAGYFFGLSIWNFILGGIIGGGVIYVIYKTTGGMGDGDAEICLLSGLFLGWKLAILMLFLSFVLGGIVGIFLLMTKKKSRKDYIPFGPYIAIGSFISVYFGMNIINWYLSIL